MKLFFFYLNSCYQGDWFHSLTVIQDFEKPQRVSAETTLMTASLQLRNLVHIVQAALGVVIALKMEQKSKKLKNLHVISLI